MQPDPLRRQRRGEELLRVQADPLAEQPVRAWGRATVPGAPHCPSGFYCVHADHAGVAETEIDFGAVVGCLRCGGREPTR